MEADMKAPQEPRAPGLGASAPDRLAAAGVSLGYGNRRIVNNLSMSLPAGRVTMIVGANACGKSTLLRGLARLLKPEAGTVLLDGKDIFRLPSRHVATQLGILPQTPTAPEGISVADLVGRGRTPHQGWFGQRSSADDDAVDAALQATDTRELALRNVDELSGGQRQRVWIAMALAQQTDILLLDEPTTYLDLAHQVEVLELVAELNASRGTTVGIVLHDLNLAARYGDHLIAMKDGGIVAAGPPDEVLTEELVRTVFQLEAKVVPDPVCGSPMVVPLGRRRRTAVPVPAAFPAPTAVPVSAPVGASVSAPAGASAPIPKVVA
jgi:iron complex transport system ATP-binding protein